MTETNNQHQHKDLLKGLESSNSIKVIETLEELRFSGKASDIPLLIELLHLTNDPEVKSKVTELFNTLKESDAIPLIVEAIQNQKYASELKELVASCWENGLDYSHYLALFVDLLIESEFLVAFEAYTVITNMTAKIDTQTIDREITKLDEALKNATEQKHGLIIDVIDFLPSIAG